MLIVNGHSKPVYWGWSIRDGLKSWILLPPTLLTLTHHVWIIFFVKFYFESVEVILETGFSTDIYYRSVGFNKNSFHLRSVKYFDSKPLKNTNLNTFNIQNTIVYLSISIDSKPIVLNLQSRDWRLFDTKIEFKL